MVVVSHLGEYAVPGIPFAAGLKNGVVVFFVLSGYLLYRPFLGSVDLRAYATTRIARILPAYWLALVGTTLLTGRSDFLQAPITYLLFLQNLDPSRWQGFLGVSWTLCVEAAFYLALPLLAVVVGGKLGRLAVLGACSFACAAVITLAAAGSIPWTTYSWASSLDPFMLWAFVPGMVVAVLESRGQLGRVRKGWGLIGCCLIGLGATMPAIWASVDIVTAIGASLVVACVVVYRPAFGRVAPLASCGAALSYAVYLWHVDLIKTYPVPLAVALAIAITSASYLLIERPSILMGKSVAARLRHATLRPLPGPTL